MCPNECTFPADMILLASSSKGECYIQTSSLDGEKNLKKRRLPKDISTKVNITKQD